MPTEQAFEMKCASDHRWIETYPTAHTLFGICPHCPGKVQGRVLQILDDPATHVREGIFVHQCVMPGCEAMVLLDDEPWCFTHSPDEGSSLLGYSARQRLTAGVSMPPFPERAA